MSVRLGFMGGASGIGASCVLIALDGLRVVVDCGIRQARGETLPDLQMIVDALGGAAPDAVVLTHAHLDHSGALPVLHRAWPDVPIVTTRATAELVRILLLDAIKVMDAERDQEIPLYSTAEVEKTLAAVRPADFDDPVEIASGRVRLLPAGHILGAGCALLEVDGRTVLVSGDISVTDQRTVSGMPSPAVRPDVMVVESTYGNRMHASRAAEERRLYAQVGQAIAAGGHVLIPAFAVGRAQEVLLVLAHAMAKGEIAEFPVYADGMVRAVCHAYRNHPAFLQKRLRQRVLRGRHDVFFGAAGSPFQPVASHAHREQIISGPPCCVVASSGMLAGGASPLYARAWAPEAGSLIAITGYQDEESPGRTLLDLADGKTRTLRLPGGTVEVGCRVTRYHLSAHADADEIAGLVGGLAPGSVYVVHGEQAAREMLGARLEDAVRGDVSLPEDGELLEGSSRRRRRPPFWPGPGISAGRALDADGLGEVADLLLTPGKPRQRLLTAEHIAQVWFGAGAAGAENVRATRALLEEPQTSFKPDPRLPFRYRPQPTRALEAERQGPAPVAEVLSTLDRRLPHEESGLYRRSAHQEEHRIILRFTFPDVQGPAAREAIEAITAETGWTFEVHPHPRQESLGEAARALLPDGCRVLAGPSLLLDVKQLRLGVHPLPDPDEVTAMVERFATTTGWSLELEAADISANLAAGVPAGDPGEPATPPVEHILSPQEARQHVLAAFAGVTGAQAPLKVSYPHATIILHFVHPGIAERHAERVAALGAATGREIRIHPHAAHQQLVELARPIIPDDWTVTRALSYVPQTGAVRIPVWSLPPSEQIARVADEVRAAVGCPIEVVPGSGAAQSK